MKDVIIQLLVVDPINDYLGALTLKYSKEILKRNREILEENKCYLKDG